MASTPHRDQHRVWESIADSFDRHRTRTWPHVAAFVAALTPGSLVADLMGGNGRHTATLLEHGHRALWLDWSRPAARITAGRHPGAGVVVADATRLPLRDGCLDAAVWVAGLHGVPTPDGRAACLGELCRVLRPDGVAQVTVWSRDAPRFRDQGTPGEPLDVTLPWRADGHDAVRTYHLHTPASLRASVQAAGLEVVRQDAVAVVSEEPDNLVVEVRRPAAAL